MKCFTIFICTLVTLLHNANSVKRLLPSARPSEKRQKFDDPADTDVPSSSASSSSRASSSTAAGDVPSTGNVLKKIYLENKLSAKDVHESRCCDRVFIFGLLKCLDIF